MKNVEQEISEKLGNGHLPTELIREGYKKSTVYKVHSRTSRPCCYSKKYLIVELSRVAGIVKMILQETHEFVPSPPQEEEAEQQLKIENIAQPIPQTDEEKMMKKIFAAMKKFEPNLFSSFTETPKKISFAAPIKALNEITIIMSVEDYVNLGKPSLLDALEVNLNKTRSAQEEGMKK